VIDSSSWMSPVRGRVAVQVWVLTYLTADMQQGCLTRPVQDDNR
jgi:hypothetical protein